MSERFSDEQVRQWAREVIDGVVQDWAADWGGIGEQFEDEWAHLSEKEFDEVRERVYQAVRSATVTVSWGDPSAPQQEEGRSDA